MQYSHLLHFNYSNSLSRNWKHGYLLPGSFIEHNALITFIDIVLKFVFVPRFIANSSAGFKLFVYMGGGGGGAYVRVYLRKEH